MANARALVVVRPTDDGYAETILFQALLCRGHDCRVLQREIRALLRRVGFQRTFLEVSLEPSSPAEPDPLLFGDIPDGAGPHARRIIVRFGHQDDEFVTAEHYNRQQFRVLRETFRLILQRVGIHVRDVRYG